MFRDATDSERNEWLKKYPDGNVVPQPTERTPLYEAAGAVFNPNTGYYELNGLLDITEEQMAIIYSTGVLTLPKAAAIGLKCRTNILMCESRYLLMGGHRKADISGLCDNNLTVEVIRLCSDYMITKGDRVMIEEWFVAFQAATELKRIIGYLDLELLETAETRYIFQGCHKLESVYLMHLKKSIWFNNSSRLKLECIEYMIDNALNTKTITIYLHPDVLEKISSEVQAKADAKNIVLATV